MSRQEQAALMAWLNSFRPSRRVTAFDQLSDGKTLMEVMSLIDATHFKGTSGRGTPGPSSSTTENWVLKSNTLKRLYRLLQSIPVQPPHHPLSTSSLPEPPFSAIVKSATSPDGAAGLIQIVRMCLAVGVWAPGNEKVIGKIQGLGEAHMNELMKSIEEVMGTMPPEEGAEEEKGASPIKRSPDLRDLRPPSPPSEVRVERDRLSQENDELRTRCEQMIEQVAELTTSLDEAKAETEEALARLAASRETSSAPGAGLRSSQTAAVDVDVLRADLARAEDELAKTEDALGKQNSQVAELSKTVDDLRAKADEATKLKDQLDEYRHTAERLQKSENVIEKYKKKLEESAGLRREMRASSRHASCTLEEENAALVEANSTLEGELKKVGASKTLLDNYRSQIEALERKSNDQASEFAELSVQLEATRAQLLDAEREHERDRDELELHQERMRELELGTAPGALARRASKLSISGKTTLEDELELDGEVEGQGETKTDLKLRIRALQRELASAKSPDSKGHHVSALETLLADANKARYRYQADYLEAHRGTLRLQAALEQIRSGKGVDTSQTVVALRQRLDELLEERDRLLNEKTQEKVAKEEASRELQTARTDLSLVNKDQRDILAALRAQAEQDTVAHKEGHSRLKEEVAALKEKDRLHLEETKKLLMEKVDLQSAGISQRELALQRERDFGDLRQRLADKGVPQETQQEVLQLQSRNADLESKVEAINEELRRAKDAQAQAVIDESSRGDLDFGEAQKSYEAQIAKLKEDVVRSRTAAAALEKRYKLEQQLMLSAWHDLGSRTVREHVAKAGTRRSQPKPQPSGWLGRQRRWQEDATFSR